MEKFAYELKHMIQDKLFLYEELKKILNQEKKYIGDMDVDALWEMAENKNNIAVKIEEKRKEIYHFFKAHDIPFKAESKSFSLVDVINHLPFPATVKSEFKKIKVELDIIKKELVGMAFDNRKYANGYLDVLNGVFETITGSQNLEKYSNRGQTLKPKTEKYLIRAEV